MIAFLTKVTLQRGCMLITMASNRRGKNAKLSEYGIWASMKQRCNNPKSQMWYLYGKRGIGFCKSWESFDNFYRDMGQKPIGFSLGRINNDQNYSPRNCRWESTMQQSRNKRNNHFISFQGKHMVMSDWSKLLGFKKSLISSRLRNGWSIKDALTFRPLADGVNRRSV